MQILDYNEKINTAMVQVMPVSHARHNISTAGSVGDVEARREKDLCEQSFVQSSAEKTSLKAGFNTHSIELPNGCIIKVQEGGEISLQESGAAPKKLRHKDSVQNFLVK